MPPKTRVVTNMKQSSPPDDTRLHLPGIEVIVVNKDHPKFDAIGVTAGLGDCIGQARVRVHFNGEVFLFDASDLKEN